MLFAMAGVYRNNDLTCSLRMRVRRVLVAVALGAGVAYFALRGRLGDDHALALTAGALPLIAVGTVAIRRLAYVARGGLVGTRRVLIVGTGAEALAVTREVDNTGRMIVGYCATGTSATSERSPDLTAPVFAADQPIDEIVRRHRVHEVVVALRDRRGGVVRMDQLLVCRSLGVAVLDVAGFFERTKGEVPVDSLTASWLVYGHGFEQGRARTLLKRLADLLGASTLLVLAAPIVVVTALAIRLDSPGEIVFRQERVGLAGRRFMCLKFRSMRTDAERDGKARWAVRNDSRVTRVGSVIRKLRIDELPQLINVLKGEMSLVGPRPERQCFIEQLQGVIPFYGIRHSVKPGLTGWAQVRYRYGASVDDARRKHQFDLYYVKNHSLLLDLQVLMETVSVVLFGEGAQ
jgi:sugar transferase (PEP-CTERM system associated)